MSAEPASVPKRETVRQTWHWFSIARARAMTSQLRATPLKPPPAGARMTSAPRRAWIRATSGSQSSEQTSSPTVTPSRSNVARCSPGATPVPLRIGWTSPVAGCARA